MSVAASLEQDTEPRGAGAHRPCGSLPAATLDAAPCVGCRVRTMTPCAAPSVIGGTVVPPFRISEQRFPAGREIVGQGESGQQCFVITEGWAVQYELIEDGGRQILDFLLPGSTVGFHPEGEARSPHFVRALTGVRACRLSMEGFLRAAKSNPALALRLAAVASRSHYRTLRRLTLIGRRTAKERVAVLLFELHRRVQRWSLSPREDEIPLPLTQEHIGDALGLTNVHVNRMLRELREEGVLVLRNGVLRLLDPGLLAAIAGDDEHRFARRPPPGAPTLRANRREAALT